MKEVLIIGYGSIGKQHAACLQQLNIRPVVLTKYPDSSRYIRFISNLELVNNISHCIIATPTANHCNDFIKVIENTTCKNILIEKPVDSDLDKSKDILKISQKFGINVYIAYDMRFIHAFSKIKEVLKSEKSKIRIVKITVGQYLPEWRPSIDYRTSYSAIKEKGGGVDLDLSHEIDYMLWMFGKPEKKLYLLKKKLSDLAINSTDYFKGLYDYSTFIVDVELDYFRKIERSMRIIGENGDILFVDFIMGKLQIYGNEIEDSKYLFNKDALKLEISEFLNNSNKEKLCSLKEGVKVLEFIK